MAYPKADFPHAEVAVQWFARIVGIAVFCLAIIPAIILNVAYHSVLNAWKICDESLEASQ